MSTHQHQPGRLQKDALGVPGIVFLVLAAVAPLTAMIAIAPLGIALGNGGGLPGAFLLVTVTLALFAIGYAQMSRHVVNAGAFYTYVTKALGRHAGVATAYLAVLGYNAFMVGATATSGFFTAGIVDDVLGLDLPWQIWSAISLTAVAVLGRRGIDISAKILGVSLVLEVLILLVLDVAILVSDGWDLGAFDPDLVFSGAAGIGLLFAFVSYVGFEAVALFSEEARDPRRTIPRATLTAVVLMGSFYVVTTLSLVSAFGADAAKAAANDPEAGGPGAYVFRIAGDQLGSFLLDVMQLLLVVSLFAALLALHNSSTRYLYALGRARLLPRALGRTHSRTGAPHVASGVQIAFDVVAVGAFAIAGADPLLVISASMTGFGALGIVALQAAAAMSVVVFFRRRRDPRLFSTAIAPALGAAGLITAFTLAVANFDVLAGSDSPVIGKLPWLVPVVIATGVLYAAFLQRNRPEIYAGLGDEDGEIQPPAAGEGVPARA
jgi:amino acid transporter